MNANGSLTCNKLILSILCVLANATEKAATTELIHFAEHIEINCIGA